MTGYDDTPGANRVTVTDQFMRSTDFVGETFKRNVLADVTGLVSRAADGGYDCEIVSVKVNGTERIGDVKQTSLRYLRPACLTMHLTQRREGYEGDYTGLEMA